MTTIKKALYNKCLEDTEARILVISKALESVSESRNNETKSSAGDKYETGRAMMQIEEDKNRSQLYQARQVLHTLQRIDPSKETVNVGIGSLVVTNRGSYFISIGMGKVVIDTSKYYCVSIESPIGMMLKGRAVGDQMEFNGILTILSIQ